MERKRIFHSALLNYGRYDMATESTPPHNSHSGIKFGPGNTSYTLNIKIVGGS